MSLPFSYLVTENKTAFLNKVQLIASYLKIPASWLMIVMASESGLNSHIVNSIGAVGLIQFLPGTAYGLGTTPEALRSMSNVQQLDYVYAYFKPYVGKYKSVYDLYLVAFYPYALGKSDMFVIGSEISQQRAKLIGAQNSGFDLNKNGVVTVGEFKAYIQKKYGKYIQSSISNKSLLNGVVLALSLYFLFEDELKN